VVDGVLYMSAGLLGGTLAGDKHWIKVDLPARSGATANQPNTYAGILQYLRGTDPDAVTRIGSDTVRGVRTTHYAATVRVDQLRKRLSQARLSSAQRRQLEQALRLYVTATFDIDVWVDGAGRVRRETTEVPFTFAGHVVNETVTAEWFDFGVALHVTAPPASDVADLSSLGTASALG
jgi:hypothetical protein